MIRFLRRSGHERRLLPRIRATKRGLPRTRTRARMPELTFSSIVASHRAEQGSAIERFEAATRKQGVPSNASIPPPRKQANQQSSDHRGSRTQHKHKQSAMALPTYGSVPAQPVAPTINWRRRLRRAAVCAGAGLAISRALVNQGGVRIDEQTSASALHIIEDQLDDLMTEDCNMSDGRSTFIEWVQYLMDYSTEVTPAAGAVLLDRGQFPPELYRTQDPVAARTKTMLDGYDAALEGCVADPNLCLAEQFFFGDATTCQAMSNAEVMPWPDIACAEDCVETMLRDQRPDLSTCSDPVTAAMIEAPLLFKSFFEEGSDGRNCVDLCMAANVANPFTISCSSEATAVHHNTATREKRP